MKKNVKLDEGYFLVSQEVNSKVTVEVTKKTNHIFVVDVSGSMSSDLPLIRTQLKNKLSNLMKEGDTISIVWFSGRNDSGILKEEVEVKSLKTLSDLNDAIDKWLRPVGLTAFLKPLQLVKDLIQRIKKNRPDSVFSMIFLTDGYNNDCPWNDVTKTLKELENDITASTFVEYGYYADTQKITQMASILGGEKISCDGFDDFEPMFSKKISTSARGGKKTLVTLTDKYLYDFAFSVGDDGSVVLYNITDNKIMVGGDIPEVFFFSTTGPGGIMNVEAPLYAAIYVLSDKLMNDDAEKIFYALGDNFYYKMLVNAFGKQKLNAFKTAIKECVADVSKRFPDGRGDIKKVDDNAYCLMNLIEDLGNIDNCLFYPHHESFSYSRIGRKRVARGENLSEADKKRLAEAKDVETLTKITEELKEKNVELTFKNSDPERGYTLTDLVWNEERANLSVRVRIEGEVLLPKNKFNVEKVATYKYNTFTLIKDGIVNVEELPVSYSLEVEDLLVRNGVKFSIDGGVFVIDLTSIPLVNRGMVRSISANELAKQEWELVKLQGAKKVYDHYRKTLFPKTSKTFALMLGQECADWLKTIGITDYNGFAPLVDLEESTDFYMSVNLATKIKGLSSLPKVEDVLAKIKSGKPLKLNELVMEDAIKAFEATEKQIKSASKTDDLYNQNLEAYLVTMSTQSNKAKRKIMQEIAEIKFALILSKKWFKEFKSFDENSLNIKLDNQSLDFTFDLSEKEVKI